MPYATRETIAALVADNPALNTLRDFDPVELLALIGDEAAAITDDDELFDALMGVMHQTRPKGWL
jgi:hypothetical protein